MITDNQNSIEKNVPLDKNELFETAFFTTNPIQTYPSHTLNTKHTETQNVHEACKNTVKTVNSRLTDD